MGDTLIADAMSRQQRGDRYLQTDLGGQRTWYSSRARSYRQRTQLLAISIIAAGAATSFAQVFSERWWVPILTAALGSYVVIAEGWQRIARYSETWLSYRIASESIKHEQRLFQNGAGGYRQLDDDEAFLRFVEAVEEIIGGEQRMFKQKRQFSGPGMSGGAKEPEPG